MPTHLLRLLLPPLRLVCLLLLHNRLRLPLRRRQCGGVRLRQSTTAPEVEAVVVLLPVRDDPLLSGGSGPEKRCRPRKSRGFAASFSLGLCCPILLLLGLLRLRL